MKTGRLVCLILLIMCAGVSFTGNNTWPRIVSKNRKKKQRKRPRLLMLMWRVSTDHPEFEEGVTCNDCHEIKLDANTTATQVWLSGGIPRSCSR